MIGAKHLTSAQRSTPDLGSVAIPVRLDAPCKRVAAPLWDYDLDGETDQQRHARHVDAVDICQTCPVPKTCKRARNTDPILPEGVWGGRLYALGRAYSMAVKCGECGGLIPRQRQLGASENCGADRCVKDSKNARVAALKTGQPVKACDDTDDEIPVAVEPEGELRSCDWCRKRFAQRRPDMRFCRPTCRKLASQCGRELTQEQRRRGSKNCGEDCRAAIREERAKAGTGPRRHLPVHAVCVIDGQPIPVPRRKKRAKTCGQACEIAMRSARERARKAAKRQRGAEAASSAEMGAAA